MLCVSIHNTLHIFIRGAMAKRFSFMVFAFMVALFGTIIFPYNTQTTNALSIKDSNIVYNSIDKLIEIEENKVLNITETITLTYKKSGINVGLSRHISRTNKVTRIVNGDKIAKTYVHTLKLESVTMNGEDEYSFVERDGDYYVINIGAAGDYKSAGQYVYEINYTYDLGEDFISSFDDFTFDLMDYDYLTSVENFSATIKLPKLASDILDNLTFRTNDFEGLGHEAVNLNVSSEIDENGTTKSVLRLNMQDIPAQTGLTIQLLLPHNFFDTNFVPHPLYYVTIAVSIVAVIGIILLLLSHKFHKKEIVTVEFYPPKNCSAIDVAKIYRGKAKPKDFTALILEWASKKLIKIELVDKKTVKLVKLQDFPKIENIPDELVKSKLNEHELFDAFFAGGDTFVAKKNKVIKNTKLAEASRKIYKQEDETKKNSFILRMAVSILAVLPILFQIIWYNAFVGGAFFYLIILIFPIIALLVLTYTPIPWWFKLIWCSFFGGLPLGMMISFMFIPYDFLYLSIITALILIVGFCLAPLVKVFTKFERSMQGKVIGFKNFLKVAELDKLNALVQDDPEYFYHILPYCYIFNLTDKMEEKFKALNVENPDYLNGNSTAIVAGCIGSVITHRIVGFSSSSSSSSFRGGGGRRGSSGGGAGGGGARGR